LRVFITGAGGSLGSYICRGLLQAGHDLTGYSRSKEISDGMNWIRGDAGNCTDLANGSVGHDAIIHLAAIPGPGRASPEVLIAANVSTTTCVLEAAVRSKVPHVVFASSGATLGFTFQRRITTPRYLPIDELHPCEPQDPYGLSKLLGELAGRSYSDAFGIGTTCLRVNNAWYLDREGANLAMRCGWARGLTVEQLWEQRYAKIVADVSDDWAEFWTSFTAEASLGCDDARDVARAFCLTVERPVAEHEVFNLAGGETCSLKTTSELLAQYFPRVPLTRPIRSFDAIFSQEKAAQLLGLCAEYSWRKTDFSNWLALVHGRSA
jgi:nucleoside-diphosphate-sugar epimerase